MRFILHKPDTHQVYFATLVHLGRTLKYRQQTSGDLIRLHQHNTPFSSVNESSEYTAKKYGLNTSPCLTPKDT